MTQNTMPLSKGMLEILLLHLSNILPRPLRLVVHGGACMILHPGLEHIPTQRVSTMDIDYLHRGVISEYGAAAAQELLQCIYTTSLGFPGLGSDWMNAEADVSLPTTHSPPYDPVYHSSIQPNNVALHTIYTSPNKYLILVSVTPFWGVALKLVRFSTYDMADICVLLRNGTRMKGIKWNDKMVERWIRTECASMRYDLYSEEKMDELRDRIRRVVYMVEDAVFLESQAAMESSWRRHTQRTQCPPEDHGRTTQWRLQMPDYNDSDSDSDSDDPSDDSDNDRTKDMLLVSLPEKQLRPFIPATQPVHHRPSPQPARAFIPDDGDYIPPFIPPHTLPSHDALRSDLTQLLSSSNIYAQSLPSQSPQYGIPTRPRSMMIGTSLSSLPPSFIPTSITPAPSLHLPVFSQSAGPPHLLSQSSHPPFGEVFSNEHSAFSPSRTPSTSPVIPPRPQDWSMPMNSLRQYSNSPVPFMPPGF